jgi:hypothetical protein
VLKCVLFENRCEQDPIDTLLPKSVHKSFPQQLIFAEIHRLVELEAIVCNSKEQLGLVARYYLDKHLVVEFGQRSSLVELNLELKGKLAPLVQRFADASSVDSLHFTLNKHLDLPFRWFCSCAVRLADNHTHASTRLILNANQRLHRVGLFRYRFGTTRDSFN